MESVFLTREEACGLIRSAVSTSYKLERLGLFPKPTIYVGAKPLWRKDTFLDEVQALSALNLKPAKKQPDALNPEKRRGRRKLLPSAA